VRHLARHEQVATPQGPDEAEAVVEALIAARDDSINNVPTTSRVTWLPSRSGGGRFFTGGNSFPSGHATNAFALATVIANEYKDRPLVRWGAYGVAGLVGVSRFTGRRHFLSDVVVGGAIGYSIGRYVYHTHHDPAQDPPEGGLRKARSRVFPIIEPIFDRGEQTYGALLAWGF
jgi:membrane-associated phospholipid phosphatase